MLYGGRELCGVGEIFYDAAKNEKVSFRYRDPTLENREFTINVAEMKRDWFNKYLIGMCQWRYLIVLDPL